jgi:hypothetical protein
MLDLRVFFKNESKVIQSKAHSDWLWNTDRIIEEFELTSYSSYPECDVAITGLSLLSLVFIIPDEREDVQKKTFAKWINSQLLKVSMCR